jgi:hypothetical protein
MLIVFCGFHRSALAKLKQKGIWDQAGHASPTTTAIYAKTNNTARKRQVEALDED